MPDGRLLFSHYAFMPNRLGYCGGSDNQTMLDYCVAGESDQGLDQLIRQFQAAYPYLQFIAQSNGILSPLEPQVVEAYWIGNSLLDQVDMAEYHEFLAEKVGPRVSSKDLEYIMGKVPQGAKPHHSFHVLDVSMRAGALRESVDDLDRCRISWGEVQQAQGGILTVRYQPLELIDGKLALGPHKDRQVAYQIEGKGYLQAPIPGDLVSMHWDWACDLISPRQAAILKRQTLEHLALANQTL